MVKIYIRDRKKKGKKMEIKRNNGKKERKKNGVQWGAGESILIIKGSTNTDKHHTSQNTKGYEEIFENYISR